MTILQAVLYGIVQGITEFLPVSSTGHLVILRNIFHIQTEEGLLTDIMLRLGTLIPVLIAFHRDIGRLLAETVFMLGDLLVNFRILILNRIHKTSVQYRKIIRGSYRRFCILLLFSAILSDGIAFAGRYLFAAAGETLLIPGIAFLITAVILMMADTAPEGYKLPRGTAYRDSLVIGMAHGLAAMPGLSRSGAALTAGALCGLDRKFALKYSFILLVPVNLILLIPECAAVSWQNIPVETAAICIAGAFCAGAAGFVCIRLMFQLVRNHKYRLLSAWCLLIGAVAIGGHFFL